MSTHHLHLSGRLVEAAWWSEDAARPPFVLLHEGLGSVGLWRGFPAQLAEAANRALFAYSRFGYGRSDPQPPPWPLNYMHREALEILPRVLDQAGIAQCVLVGHSDGASIAAIAAGIGDRRRYLGLVLIAPHFFVEDVTLTAIAEARSRYETGRLRERLRHHHRDPDACFYGWNRAWLDPDFRTSFDLSEELTYIRVPMLIIQGQHDPYGTAVQPRLAEETCYCPVRTILLNAAHAPHLDASEETTRAVVHFAKRLLQAYNHAS